MSERRTHTKRSQKTPRQPRSRQMVADLVEGAARVLDDRGPHGFTTNHVAEATGASIGSLYQYFPNKGALLAALHDREGRALWVAAEAILLDPARPPRERLTDVVHLACRVQAEAVALQRAMEGADIAATSTAGFAALREQVVAGLVRFAREAANHRAADAPRLARQAFALLVAALQALAEDPRDPDGAARDTVTMLAAVLFTQPNTTPLPRGDS